MTTDASQSAQSAEMPKPVPRQEHEWLQQLVGEWEFEGEASMGPGKPAEVFRGSESVRTFGGLWFLSEGKGEAADGASSSVSTLGYDPQKQRFVGTFITSMMTYLWIYDGSLDAARKVLTLDTEGPGMSGDGTMARYRDVIEIESADRRSTTSNVQSADGTWTQFMKMTYRRTT